MCVWGAIAGNTVTFLNVRDHCIQIQVQKYHISMGMMYAILLQKCKIRNLGETLLFIL